MTLEHLRLILRPLGSELLRLEDRRNTARLIKMVQMLSAALDYDRVLLESTGDFELVKRAVVIDDLLENVTDIAHRAIDVENFPILEGEHLREQILESAQEQWDAV